MNGGSEAARTQMERALSEGGDSPLVQRLAAEMALGIPEFVEFPQAHGSVKVRTAARWFD